MEATGLPSSSLQGAVTQGPQQTAYSWCQLSRLKFHFTPVPSNTLLTAIFSPPSCSPGLFQQAIAKFLLNPHIPKKLNYVWKLNDMLGKRAYSTMRQCLWQSLLWLTQPADPLNTISPCLLGKRQFKPHGCFTYYTHVTKTTAKQHNKASCSPGKPTLHHQFMAHSWEHTNQEQHQPNLRFC